MFAGKVSDFLFSALKTSTLNIFIYPFNPDPHPGFSLDPDPDPHQNNLDLKQFLDISRPTSSSRRRRRSCRPRRWQRGAGAPCGGAATSWSAPACSRTRCSPKQKKNFFCSQKGLTMTTKIKRAYACFCWVCLIQYSNKQF